MIFGVSLSGIDHFVLNGGLFVNVLCNVPILLVRFATLDGNSYCGYAFFFYLMYFVNNYTYVTHLILSNHKNVYCASKSAY